MNATPVSLDTPASPWARVAVFGATSGIAHAMARRLAAGGATLHLVARDPARLEAHAADLRARGARAVTTRVADLAAPGSGEAEAKAAFADPAGVDLAIVAFGVLGAVEEEEASPVLAARRFGVNATAVVELGLALGACFERQGRGTIALFSSVAGDRGRRSNYPYGAAKAAVTAFAEGLRARLAPKGVHVATIKPGPVDTPMTAHLPRSPMLADPDRVAAAILRGLARRRGVIYAPWPWRWVMLVLRLLPEPLFRKVP